MNNTMEYKGYVGTVEFSESDGLFYGKVMGIRALISYDGTNAHELVEDFHGAVDDYLALCEAEGIQPEKAYKGSFNVRISPELHKRAVICAAENQMTLNSFVESAMRQALAKAN
jgi:predicted HicB family RNase H-like nuclease